MTLLELLVVLGILGVLAGLSVVGLQSWKRRVLLETCLGDICLKLREVRNFALDGSVGGVVEVDPRDGVFRAWSFRRVALVSFDDGDKPLLSAGASRTAGRLGEGVDLSGGGKVSVPGAESFLGNNGFALRMFVLLSGRPPERSARWTLAAAEERSFDVTVNPDLSLTVSLGEWKGRTESGTMIPGRWQELTFSWIRLGPDDEVSLLLDSLEVPLRNVEETGSGVPEIDSKRGWKLRGKSPAFPRRLHFGPLGGYLDEILILTVVADPEFSLPGEFALVGPRGRIHFAPSGELDLRYHDEPAVIHVVPSLLLEELMHRGKTAVPGAVNVNLFPPDEVSRVTVEVSGRIRFEKARKRRRAEPAAGKEKGGKK